MPKSIKRSVKIFSKKKFLKPTEAAALYVELGWGTVRAYSTERMRRSLANCDIVVFARNEAGELVGISRALSDFAIETKILDMIVAPEYQRQGVGAAMMKKIESLTKGTNLYCETERKNFGFVARLGYEKRKGLAIFRKKN